MHLLRTLIYPVVLLVVVASSHAQKTDPKPLETPSPRYPAALADTGISGTAVVDIVVLPDGSVGDPKIKSADHEALGDAAVTAIKQWRFTPATVDGAPVERKVSVPFQFSAPVADVINARLKRKMFQKITDPVLTEKEFGKKLKASKPPKPNYPPAAKGARQNVEVRFVVAPDGTTLNPEIIGEARKEFLAPAIFAVAAATYQPPVKDGKKVYVATSTKLSFAPPQRPAGKRGGGGGGGGRGDAGGGGGGGFGGGGGGDPE